MNASDFRNRKNNIIKNLDDTVLELQSGADELQRVGHVLSNTKEILGDLDSAFCKKTGLNEIDVSFLFLAVGLQIARQYLLTKFPERLGNQEAAKLVEGKKGKNIGRNHTYYNPSFEEIVKNPVPFDDNIGSNGALKGGGFMGHRVTAIGHDPIVGLIFGTANIATSTLTTATLESYHIYRNANKRDYFESKARTELVLIHTLNKLLNEGIEGKKKVAVSLIKEIIHLRSDLNTKNSLPLPGVSLINPGLASDLAKYGFDMANVVAVGKQASYSMMINSIIAMIHRLFFVGESEMDLKLYEVKTRKILSYSNLIASTSNLAVVSITKDMRYLDLGGLGVTIYRLITDRKFIKQVKEEFIFGSYEKLITNV